jgi:hypothetical protein
MASDRSIGKNSGARGPDNSDIVADAVARIVPRRHLLIEDGDIYITHGIGLKGAGERIVYQLARRGHGSTPDRFTTFEHAVAGGDELARVRRVRLFYLDRPDGLPQLLKDYRPQ